MAGYRFITEWQVDAPIDAVWEQLTHPDDWPGWWKGVEKVEALEPAAGSGPRDDHVGERRRYTWKSRLPYRLVFDMELTRSERPHLYEGRASGELEGTGTWTLTERDGGTRVRYLWAVRTTQPWMNIPFPFLRQIFELNHDAVMRWGGQGLGRRLGVKLVDVTAPARAGAQESEPASAAT